MYKVLEMFDDLQDFKDTKDGRVYRRYEPGDVYPQKGKSPSVDKRHPAHSADTFCHLSCP